MTPEFISAMAALVMVVIIGIKGLLYLAEIRTDIKVARTTIGRIEHDVDEMRKEVHEDSQRQWAKISDHDIEIERLKLWRPSDG